MRAFTALLVMITLAGPAQAALTRAALTDVAAHLPSNARLPLDLSAPDVSGKVMTIGAAFASRPTFLMPVDYTCKSICGVDLQLLSTAITDARLPSTAYRVVLVGIDPKDPPEAAAAFARANLPAALRDETTLLLPDAATAKRIGDALGFHAAYDKDADQFAHPAVIYAVAPDGAVRSVLSPFKLDATNLRAALDGSSPLQSLYERIHLLCYAYDPATGIYTFRILAALKALAALSLVLLGAAIFRLSRARSA